MKIENYVLRSDDAKRRVNTLTEVIERRKVEIGNAKKLIVDKEKDVEIMSGNIKDIQVEDAKRNGWFSTDVNFEVSCTREYRKAKIELLIKESKKSEFLRIFTDNERVHFDIFEAFIEKRNTFSLTAIKGIPKVITFLSKIRDADYMIVEVKKI